MQKIFLPITLIILSLIAACALHGRQDADSSVRWITKEALLASLDDSGLILLDTRYGKDWKRAERKIRHAERLDASEIDSWEGRYPSDTRIVVYCA